VDQVNRALLLEELPEIIDTGTDDEQAAETIAHGMKGGHLDKENIDQRKKRVRDQYIQKDLFGPGTVNDVPDQEEVEADDQHRFEVVQEKGVLAFPRHIVEYGFEKKIDQEKSRKILQIAFRRPPEEDSQAYQKGDAGCYGNE
jgi:hypothetical protein